MNVRVTSCFELDAVKVQCFGFKIGISGIDFWFLVSNTFETSRLSFLMSSLANKNAVTNEVTKERSGTKYSAFENTQDLLINVCFQVVDTVETS